MNSKYLPQTLYIPNNNKAIEHPHQVGCLNQTTYVLDLSHYSSSACVTVYLVGSSKSITNRNTRDNFIFSHFHIYCQNILGEFLRCYIVRQASTLVTTVKLYFFVSPTVKISLFNHIDFNLLGRKVRPSCSITTINRTVALPTSCTTKMCDGN